MLRPWGNVVIAGGAVRDELIGRIPKDYDIFILGNRRSTVVDNAIRNQLSSFTGIPATLTVDSNSNTYAASRLPVGTWLYEGAKIQVMLSRQYSATNLTETFDWNVCKYAYFGDAYSILNTSGIPDGESLRGRELVPGYLENNPLLHLRRGFRFAERYGMILPSTVLERLCREVVAYTDSLQQFPSLSGWLVPASPLLTNVTPGISTLRLDWEAR